MKWNMISDYSNYNNHTISKVTPDYGGMTLCVCTAAGCRFLFIRQFFNNFRIFIWHDYWPWTIDSLIRFWSIFVVTLTLNFMTLTLNFHGQIWNLLYRSQKWSDYHEAKSNIDWTQVLKCDLRVWPCIWPWPWIFKVKYGICYTSAKKGPIRKANISIELKAANVTLTFDHTHGLDHG